MSVLAPFGTIIILPPEVSIADIAVQKTASMLMGTRVVVSDESIAVAAAETGIRPKLPMADDIIYATGQSHSATLVITNNARLQGLPDVVSVPPRKQIRSSEEANS
ncbi:MAG: hypothetical protein N3B12_08025 [Armatimonadetes bacterium]|nr:hypothetical protein [Armatimonadota bacterium]